MSGMTTTTVENPSQMERAAQEEMGTTGHTYSPTLDAERRSEVSTAANTMTETDVEKKEKTSSGTSPAESSEVVAEEKMAQKEQGQTPGAGAGAEGPTPEEGRTKSKTALIMFSLCVRLKSTSI